MDRTSRWNARAGLAFLAVIVLVGTLAVGVAVGAAGNTGSNAETAEDIGGPDTTSLVAIDDGFAAAQDVDADRVVMRATVDENGDATWRIEYRIRLDSDDREAAFDDLEADVQENESAYVDRYADRMASTAATAADATGREMAVSDMSVTTEREQFPEETGLLVYEFRWSGFAAAETDRLVIGDAIGGLFLEEGYQLTLRWPDDHELRSATPTPDDTGDRSVTWRGSKDFATDEPRVTVAQPSVFGGSGLWVAGVIVVGILASVLYWRRDAVRQVLGVGAGDGEPQPEVKATQAPGTADASGAADASETGDTSDTADGTGTSGSAGAAGGAGATAAESADPASAESEELLSNEERVLRLLENQGGRMKQQDVVQELGWTDARTSQVVSGLREDGELESFRLGRENVLRLPEADGVGLGEAESNGGDNESDRNDGDSGGGDGEPDKGE